MNFSIELYDYHMIYCSDLHKWYVYIKCIIEMFIRIDFKKILWVFVVCYEYFILIDNYLIIFTHYHFFCFVFCFYYLSLFCCFVFLFLFCLFCFCLFCFFVYVRVCVYARKSGEGLFPGREAACSNRVIFSCG